MADGNVEAAAVAQAASNSAVNQLRNGSLLISDVMRAGMIRGVTDEVLNGFGSVLTLVADQASVAIGTGDLTGATDRNVERVQAIIDLLENFDELPATIQAGLASRVLALDEAMAEGRLEDAGEILGEFNAYAASAAVGTAGLAEGTADLLKRIGGLRATNRPPVPDRRVEIGELFDHSNPRSGIQIGDRTVLNDPTNTGGAKVFDGVSDVEVRDYFTQLTGQPLPSNPTTVVPGRGNIYTVQTPDGNFNLRDFSTSGVGRWTIDVPNSVTGVNSGRGFSELKFR